MIIEYQRPTSINEALILLARKQPLSYPLGGGTVLNRGRDEQIAVVDLQSLGLKKVTKKGNVLHIGATVTLQELMEFHGLPNDFYKAIELEATYNIRQMATIAGKLVAADGRSSLTNAILSLDSTIEIYALNQEPKRVRVGSWLPVRDKFPNGKLITMISIPLNVSFTYESIARTPADLPIVSAAVTRWASGRTRLVLGGWGSSPILAMDGPNSDGIEIAGKNAYSVAEDEWASAEYRQEMAGVLAKRCLNRLIETE